MKRIMVIAALLVGNREIRRSRVKRPPHLGRRRQPAARAEHRVLPKDRLDRQDKRAQPRGRPVSRQRLRRSVRRKPSRRKSSRRLTTPML